MILEVLIASLGAAVGVVTGLIPGIHPNLIAAIITSTKDIPLQYIPAFDLAIFVISLSMANSISNFLPSCYLGAPESDNCLTVLPGHRYLLKGKAHEAVILTTISSTLSLITIIALTPILLKITPKVYEAIKDYIGYLLIAVVLFLLYKEKGSKFLAIIVFVLSGILGAITLNFNNLKEPLLPLLSGLFGIPALVISMKNKESIPPQLITYPKLSKKTLLKTQASATIAGYLFSILPSLGPSQAAMISSSITKTSTKGFLMLSGALGTVNMALSLITLYSINKARNGSIAAIEAMLTIDTKTLITILSLLLTTIPVIIILTLLSSRIFVKLTEKVSYAKISIATIIFILSLVLIISKPIGLLIIAVSFSIGFVAYLSNIQKSHLMGALMIPTIIFFMTN